MARRMQVQRRRIFVGCEGDGERSYVAFISDLLGTIHSKIHLDPHVLRPGGGDACALVEIAEKKIRSIEATREPYGRKFILLDTDRHGQNAGRDARFAAAVNRMGASVIWQDTAHEAFLLRHLPGCATRRPVSTAVAVQQLLAEWPGYAKPMSAMHLATRLTIAALIQAAGVEPMLKELLLEIEMIPAQAE